MNYLSRLLARRKADWGRHRRLSSGASGAAGCSFQHREARAKALRSSCT